MAELANPKHELFCKLFVLEGMPKRWAYLNAGYATVNPGPPSTMLSKRPEVKARIEELSRIKRQKEAARESEREELMEKGNFDPSRDYMLRQLDATIELARRDGNIREMNRAIALMAEICGYAQQKTPSSRGPGRPSFVEKVKAGLTNPKELTPDDPASESKSTLSQLDSAFAGLDDTPIED